MRVYADTSFLGRLVTPEAGTMSAVALYRSLGQPALFFLPLHALEVANAIRQRTFHLHHSARSFEHRTIKHELDTSLARLARYIARRAFVETTVDMEPAFALAVSLSEKHTERLGCRGFDLLHVAMAINLECEVFLTSDRVQSFLAKAEGLDVTLSIEK